MDNQFIILLTFFLGWMGRKQQQVIDYLLEENRVLKEQFEATGKKLNLTVPQRRKLAVKAKNSDGRT